MNDNPAHRLHLQLFAAVRCKNRAYTRGITIYTELKFPAMLDEGWKGQSKKGGNYDRNSRNIKFIGF